MFCRFWWSLEVVWTKYGGLHKFREREIRRVGKNTPATRARAPTKSLDNLWSLGSVGAQPPGLKLPPAPKCLAFLGLVGMYLPLEGALMPVITLANISLGRRECYHRPNHIAGGRAFWQAFKPKVWVFDLFLPKTINRPLLVDFSSFYLGLRVLNIIPLHTNLDLITFGSTIVDCSLFLSDFWFCVSLFSNTFFG